MSHFDGPPTAKKRKEQKLKKLMNRLETLQARFEGNHLLYKYVNLAKYLTNFHR